MICEEEIIVVLDETMHYGRRPTPPDIYNINFQFVEGRLSVFRNKSHWVLVFEMIRYVPGACDYENGLYLYGNCLKEQGYYRSIELPVQIALPELWDETTGVFLMRRNYIRVLWNDQWLEFTPTPDEYLAAGIMFPKGRQHTNDLEPYELLAYLCWKLHSPFFLSEEDLYTMVREAITEGTPDLQLIFQTCEWQHPNLDKGELPSELPGMRILARLIAEADPSVWDEFNPCWVNTTFTHVVQMNWEFLYPSLPATTPTTTSDVVYYLEPFVNHNSARTDVPDEKYGD